MTIGMLYHEYTHPNPKQTAKQIIRCSFPLLVEYSLQTLQPLSGSLVGQDIMCFPRIHETQQCESICLENRKQYDGL